MKTIKWAIFRQERVNFSLKKFLTIQQLAFSKLIISEMVTLTNKLRFHFYYYLFYNKHTILLFVKNLRSCLTREFISFCVNKVCRNKETQKICALI
jgi:hypothetical protein